MPTLVLANALEILPFRDQALLVSGGVNLSSRVDFLVDKEDKLSLEKIRHGELDWYENHRDIIDLGFQKNPVWMRMDLVFGESEKEDWFLHLGTGLLRDVEVYFINSDEIKYKYIVKALDSFFKKPYEHRDFIFPFHASSGEHLSVYVGLEHANQMLMTVYLQDDDSLSSS